MDAGFGGHRTIANGEEFFDMRNDFGIFNEAFSEKGGDLIAGDVVGSWAEAAGGDDEIGGGKRIGNRANNVFGAIADRHLAANGVAAIRELAAEPLLVGVENEPEHEFAAGVDDFNDHGGELMS